MLPKGAAPIRDQQMFDCIPSETDIEPIQLVRSFLFDHGHQLAEAAALLGGPSAEAMAISCGVAVEEAAVVTSSVRRRLIRLHRLLTLENVGDPYALETDLCMALDPASVEVETICLLTDLLAELLRAIGCFEGDLSAT